MAEASLTTLYTSLIPTHPWRKPYVSSPTSFPRKSCVFRCSVASSTVNYSKKIPWGCDSDSMENASALEKWLTEKGLPEQRMKLERVEVGERGLVALKNIRNGEKLLFVPPSLVISPDSEWSNPEAGQVLKRNSVPDWPLLATYLISEASCMKSSKWSNYIEALPRQPYSLLYWYASNSAFNYFRFSGFLSFPLQTGVLSVFPPTASESNFRTRTELDTYLVASQIRERAIERINGVTGTYNDLRARIFSKHPNLFPEEVFNMETFKWSFGILFSRLVRLPSLNDKVALVPWADMLNHSCEVETFLDYDKSSQGVVFTTDRPYQPGEQVFISYGRKSNGELLLSYGFVPKEGTNPSDSADLSVSLNKSDVCYNEKLEVLNKYGLSATERFPIRITGWPVELLAYAYLIVSPPTMARQFEEMAIAASNKTTDNKEVRYPELEEEAFQFILDNCESTISKYTKFLKGSGSIDLDVTSPSQINRRLFLKQLAVDLCTSEQRILFRTQYILRRRLRDMKSGELRGLSIFNGFFRFFE